MAVDARRFHSPSRRAVGWWLVIMAVLVAIMVTLGGLTRLTGSGLSITEWQPVTGILPPLTHSAWQTAFEKYRLIPQYRFENRGMTLSQFRAIFWWEWTHRLLGRLLAVVFLVPFIVFSATGSLVLKDWPRMALLFALGGLQGAVGWWMVESGLETRVSVSQYRLAIHLGVALLLFGALFGTAFQYLRNRKTSRESPAAGQTILWFAWGLVAIVYVQMLLGALVAGLHAGLIYNTWPSLNGHLFPEGAFAESPWWRNFFENAGLVQFEHRIVAYVVAACVLCFWIVVRKSQRLSAVRAASNMLLAVLLIQLTLGIVTLVNQAPLPLAALHQATAVALLTTALWNAFELSHRKFTAETQGARSHMRSA